MSIKTTLAAAAVGALLALPITAGAVGTTDSPDVDAPCGVDTEWMQEHWNDPSHRSEMESFMEEHEDEMGAHMFSDAFDHGSGMMGGFGMHGSSAGGHGMWQSNES